MAIPRSDKPQSGMFKVGSPLLRGRPSSTNINKILGTPNQTTLPVVRQSIISDVMSCPRYALFRHRARLLRTEYKSAPEIGTMVHLGLSELYKGGDLVTATTNVNKYVDEQKAAIREFWRARNNMEIADKETAALIQDSHLALVLMQIHWEKFPLNSARYSVTIVEKTLQHYMAEAGVACQGTVDALLYDNQLKGYFILDHKTTSLSLHAFRAAFPFDIQSRMYRWLVTRSLAEGDFGDVPVAPVIGFIHNLLRRPTIKQKISQSWEDYLAECRDWYNGTGKHSDNLAKWEKDPPLLQTVTRYDEPLLPAELIDAVTYTGRALRCHATLENFPRFGSATGMCKNHYGKPCTYIDFCSNHPINWPAIKEGRFEVRDVEE